ncbi:MAG TPA: alginate export family protein, partial [Geminicoccaceae bacterium]|nr:alginate export family protein [Geminicoccaceae bacterium]
ANIGGDADDWIEAAFEAGLDGNLGLNDYGALYGRFSVVGTATRGGIDLAGSNADDGSLDDLAVENAFVGWRSGDLLPALGGDAVDLSVGRQDYLVGTGFLFGDAGADDRGAVWLSPRDAFDFAGIARVTVGSLTGEAVYLTPNDRPDSGTELAGINLDYAIGDVAALGAGYFNVFSSDIPTRDGMDVFDLRATLGPGLLGGLVLAGEIAYEDNGDALEAYGYYGEIGYQLDELRWTPYVSYRYASFSGDDPDTPESEDFDPLFYGSTDWGTWFQGEILGEFVLLNSNLESHTLRLQLAPTEAVALNLLYHFFRLDEPESFGVTEADFAHEVNLIADWAVTDNLALTGVVGVTVPEDGAEQFTGGDETWAHFMLFAGLTF